GRVGMLLRELPKLLDLLEKLPGIEVEGLFTHFATADERNASYTEEQFLRYGEAWEIFRSRQKRVALRHVCNTAGTLNFPDMHLDAVRTGIGLYGMRPSSFCAEPFALKPVFRVVTAISQLRSLPPRWGVGYGLRYMTRGEDRIAVLPLGYHDGYSRNFSGKASVLVRGERAPVVGSVCMDQIMADVTHIPHAREGDEVVIIGSQGEECISPEEMAAHLGTINYEIPHFFSPRVPKVYL
ncbi:MAG TPA: alanine racemase, partial [Synergistaceae bacterium]|nr:alanine racemase [Synergistaceae bacterium]